MQNEMFTKHLSPSPINSRAHLLWLGVRRAQSLCLTFICSICTDKAASLTEFLIKQCKRRFRLLLSGAAVCVRAVCHRVCGDNSNVFCVFWLHKCVSCLRISNFNGTFLYSTSKSLCASVDNFSSSFLFVLRVYNVRRQKYSECGAKQQGHVFLYKPNDKLGYSVQT